MRTLHQQNNEAQYDLVLKGLEAYRAMIRVADAGVRRDDAIFIEDLERVVACASGQKGYKAAAQRVDKRVAKLRREVEEAGRRVRESKGIEVIINQYNGNTDVILPIKREDLTDGDKTLADKLYRCCDEASDLQGDYEEATFDGYIVFSVDGKVDKKTLAANILEEAPKEFGGETTGAVLYLRVASNFSFHYELDRAVEDESAPELVKPTPTKRTLDRDEAVAYFRDGRTAKELREMFPDTPKMTLAGWASAFAKGQYDE